VVNINNVYYVNGERAVGSYILLELEEYFTLTLLDNLMNKDYVVTNLLFREFIDFNDLNQNPENVWVYENDTLPILFVENIMLDGYTQSSLTVGRNPTRYLDVEPYITNKSVVTLNFSYNHSSSELSGYTHNLMSNILLPLNTKITLIDHLNDKVYEYQIPTNEDNYNYENSCEIDDLNCVKVATYPFTLFKEVGTTIDKPFLESSYYNEGIINEEFTIILDFANTDIENNYENVTLYMELHDLNGNSVRPTLYNTIKKFNIYAMVDSENTNARIYLETDYSGNEIIYNSDFINNINITSSINYKLINGNKIIDTTYEDQSMGLIIKLVDSEGNIVHREYLKNIVFKVDDQIYYPGNDHLVRINLGSGQDVISKNILITTYENNSNLEEGTYYFKISNYTSLDGIHFTELGDTELNIPVEVTKSNPNIIYGFNVNIADNNRIINKTNEEANIIFNVLQSGSLEEANITVSLYRKDELTAYEQTYSIVDLANYINDELTIYEENIYSVLLDPETNSFTLNLITTNFENTGYKWVFDLYDGITKIGTIEKFFIVKEEEDEL
ncbi:MAG: hypothetical protein PHY26_04040, partial [Bacilli bacterium]|nr:hypothetical protein [Bacilli bacterium]